MMVPGEVHKILYMTTDYSFWKFKVSAAHKETNVLPFVNEGKQEFSTHNTKTKNHSIVLLS